MDHILFLFKKFLGKLFMPVPVTLLLLLWGLLLLLRRKTRWFGVLCVLLATTLLFVCSYAPLSNQLISQLEAQVPSYRQGHIPIDYVAVLGSWHQTVADQPVTSELSPTAIIRLAEGIRVYRLNPGSKLIFTGYKGTSGEPTFFPEKMRELAVALGVPNDDILVFNGPRDTVEEAQTIAAKFPASELVLVTSAAHMPRALGLFRGVGLDPHPAPTEHLGKPSRSWWTFPDGETLANSESWAHEQLGLLWARLMGQVKDNRNHD